MFKDRKEAGQLLAKKLIKYNEKDVLVLGILRGGIIIAHEIAQQLNATLDVIIIKKMGHPDQEELAIGATGLNDYYINEEIASNISQNIIDSTIKEKQQEAREIYTFLRGKKKMSDMKDKIIIIVDDGIATGSTMMMALKIIKKQSPKKVVVAIPVAPTETMNKLKQEADEVICLSLPKVFFAIGQFYEDFHQITDEEAKGYLK